LSYYRALGLKKEPFSSSPDPALFYQSEGHKAALYRLQVAIKLKRGMSLILGDVGTGKTTLSRRLFQVVKKEKNVSSHLMLNPFYETEAEFLTAVLRLFRIAPESGPLSVVESLELIERFLYEKGVNENETVVLLIDEAQVLTSASLELLRALLNYETNEHKLLQLILMGQMELLPRVKAMNNFWDRICYRSVIPPLDMSDTEGMITFRLREAGHTTRRSLFTPRAIQEIYHYSQGYPRRITNICHDALELLVVSGKKDVDEAIIGAVIGQRSQLLEQRFVG
jgi:general secretion pathway protein A